MTFKAQNFLRQIHPLIVRYPRNFCGATTKMGILFWIVRHVSVASDPKKVGQLIRWRPLLLKAAKCRIFHDGSAWACIFSVFFKFRSSQATLLNRISVFPKYFLKYSKF